MCPPKRAGLQLCPEKNKTFKLTSQKIGNGDLLRLSGQLVQKLWDALVDLSQDRAHKGVKVVVDVVCFEMRSERENNQFPCKCSISGYLIVSDCSVLVVDRSRNGSG